MQGPDCNETYNKSFTIIIDISDFMHLENQEPCRQRVPFVIRWPEPSLSRARMDMEEKELKL